MNNNMYNNDRVNNLQLERDLQLEIVLRVIQGVRRHGVGRVRRRWRVEAVMRV